MITPCRSLFLAALTGTIILILPAGCHKGPAPVNPGATNCLVRMMISNSSGGQPDTVSYTYDPQGRLLSALTDTLLSTYAYSPAAVVKTETLHGEHFVYTYPLNSAGLASTDSNGNFFSYDANGFLQLSLYGAGGSADTITYSVTNGDVDSIFEHQTDAGTDNRLTTAFTYYSNKDLRNFGLSFLGSRSTHLVQRKNITQVLNGSVYSVAYSYSYTFDDSSRVALQTTSNGSAVYTTAYQYY